MEQVNFKEGDNIIVTDAPTWKSLNGKSAVVVKNDASPNYGDGFKKIKVDYEDGAVGWFWPHQIQLDNDINTLTDIVKHLDSVLSQTEQKDTITLERKHIDAIRNIVKMRTHLT